MTDQQVVVKTPVKRKTCETATKYAKKAEEGHVESERDVENEDVLPDHSVCASTVGSKVWKEYDVNDVNIFF